MKNGNERAKFSLADGRIEIEGTEAFVAAQLEKLEPLLQEMFTHRPPPASAQALGSDGTPASASATATSGALNDYLNLFALADGKIQILKALPGGSKAAKAQSATLLLAYANSLRGVNTTTVEEIRSMCTVHACYDQSNFSKTFKGAFGKESLTLTGSGASQAVSLTHPGKTKAKTLADSLNK